MTKYDFVAATLMVLMNVCLNFIQQDLISLFVNFSCDLRLVNDQIQCSLPKD